MPAVFQRLQTAAALSMVTAVWCWVLVALYAIWKFGVMDGYLGLGEVPFIPAIPITYLTFFIFGFGAFAITFVTGLVLCSILPPRWRLVAVLIAWLVGSAAAAVDLSFLFLDHGGSTWLPHEAVMARFYHPIVTPFWIIVGLAGAASLTRSLRQRP